MFEDFSFGTASRHPSSLPSPDSDMFARRRSSVSSTRSISPCDNRMPLFSVSHLTQQLSEQSLHNDASEAHSQYLYDDSSASAFPQHFPSPQRRTQQGRRNALSIGDTAHSRSIAALMERMIESEDQCSISPPARITSHATGPNTSDDDEGYNSSEDGSNSSVGSVQSRDSWTPNVQYRRSRDMSVTGASVVKPVRQRKVLKQRRPSDKK